MDKFQVFLRGRIEIDYTRARFYEDVVCIVLIIGLELNAMKQSHTTYKSIYQTNFFKRLVPK